MKDIKLRLAARCEAAGRPNNEDNYQVDENLADDQWGFTADKEFSLGKKGSLLLVCDGMGGMNAGEVASEIAVQAIKECFSADKLTDDVIESSVSIKDYIKKSIIYADEQIKQEGKNDESKCGMGSTIVLAWLINGKVYVGWCGDSRAYCYNSKTGLIQLSHDHSYVQELVDAGKLSAELAFDHPHNNIITRSLGDNNMVAKPDVAEFDLHNEDIILLCSDGLCGVLRDNEIEYFIKNNQTSMNECRDALWEGSRQVGWTDNTTVVLAQVVSGAATIVDKKEEVMVAETNKGFKPITVFVLAILCLFLGALLTFGYVKRAKIVELWNKVEMMFSFGEEGDISDVDGNVDGVDTIVVSFSPEQPDGEVEGSNKGKAGDKETTSKQANPGIDKEKVVDTFNGITTDSGDQEQDIVPTTEENSNLGEDTYSGDEVSGDSVVDLSEKVDVEEIKDTTINE